MKVSLTIVYAAILVSLPRPVVAVDGHQWQQMVKDWMHEENLIELLKEKAPGDIYWIGNNFSRRSCCV